MGILDDIISPIKDVVDTLEKPVKVVENIFGVIIKITKEIVEMILNMVSEIENLFNASQIETIFLSPFKEAALSAVGSVKKLLDLLAPFAPNSEGASELITEPIKDAYLMLKNSMDKVSTEVKLIMERIESESLDLIEGTESKFDSFLLKVQNIPSSINEISNKLKGNFKVETGKIFEIPSSFNPVAKADAFTSQKKVGNNFSTNVESFDDVKEKITSRFKNEHSALDMMYALIFFVIVGIIGAVYYVTQSFLPIIIIGGLIMISLIFYLIGEVLIPKFK